MFKRSTRKKRPVTRDIKNNNNNNNNNNTKLYSRGAQNFPKTLVATSDFYTRKVTRSIAVCDRQLLDATAQNLIAMANWRPGIVHPSYTVALEISVVA